MANQEMYKHDAMLHMVWSVAQADETPGNEKSVTQQEDSYLDVVRNYEEIKIDWTDFNAKRKHLGYDRERIIDEACKAIRGCGKDWKIKCLGYMQRMAHVSQEDDIENNMSDKEWSLILRAQKELGLSDDERKSSMRDLPSYKKMFTEQEALMHLIWCIAVADKGANDDKWASSEENAYFDNVAKIEKIDMNYDDFNTKRKKLNSNENQIVREACNSIKSSTKEWKLKCLGYMQRMGWVSQEDDLENNISDKEWALVLRAQKILSLTREERKNSYVGLDYLKSTLIDTIDIEFDDKYHEAKEIILREGAALPEILCDVLYIGKNRAERIFDQFERDGIVTEKDENGKRKIIKS